MKAETAIKTLLMCTMLASALITGCSNGDATTRAITSGNVSKEQLPSPSSLYGTTEFYFKPVGDSRLWHVTNRYNAPGSSEGPGYNMASYTFSGDSVEVINEFEGMPDINQWDISLSGLPGGNNKNFNKQN